MPRRREPTPLKHCLFCGTRLERLHPEGLTAFGKRRYCSRKCSVRHRTQLAPPYSKTHSAHCTACRQPFVSRLRRKTCSDECEKARIGCPSGRRFTDCKQCGAHFQISSQRGTYCSRDCAFKAKARPFPGVKKGAHSKIHLGECSVCGDLFVSRLPRGSCGRTCTMEAARRIRGATLKERDCQECGKRFMEPRAGSRFCSHLCGRRSARRQSRHLRRAAKYSNGPRENVRLAVLVARDDGKCQLCGGEVKPSVDGWPAGASMDHIIPLSEGGEHTYRNVQLAHIKCNTMRYAYPMRSPSQLRLWG